MNKEKISLFLNRTIECSLCIMIFSLPFSITTIEICATIAIICWFLKKSFFEEKRFHIAQTELNLPLAIFYLIGFLSIFFSTHVDISISAFIRKLSEYILLYFIVVDVASERRVIRNIFVALAASALIVCIDGIYQKITGHDFIRGYPLHSMQQMTSSFKFPNGFSTWIIVVLFPFISIALFYKRNQKIRMASSILAVLLAYCLFLTYTRGGIISFILALILIFLLRGGKVFYAVSGLLIAAIIILALAMPEGIGPYKGIKYYLGLSELFSGISSQHRVRIWTTGWRMFLDRPLLGQGLNTFMANYERFRIPEEYGVWYAHNCYLQIAAELGIFGLLAFLWIILRMVITSIKSWRLIKDEFLRYLYLGLFCGIAAFLLQSNVDVTIYSLRLAVLFYFSLGLLMGIKRVGLNHGKV